jgi:Fe-S-cluster containining protein
MFRLLENTMIYKVLFYISVYILKKLEQKLEKVINSKYFNQVENYEELIKHMEKVIKIFKLFAPCKKRCPNCCKMDVAISELEIIFIDNYLAEKKNNKIIRKTENIVNIYKKEMNGEIFGKMCNGEKCPFLEDDECSIYSKRPYFCREYMVFEKNNKKCGYNDEWADQLGSLINRKAYFKIITQNKDTKNIVHESQVLFEIRDCFYEISYT